MTAKTKKWLITCSSVLLVALVLCFSTITASAYGNNDDAYLFIVDMNTEEFLGTVTDANLTNSYTALYEINVMVNSSTDNKSVEYYFTHTLDDSYPNGVNALNINGVNYPLIYYGNSAVGGTPQFYTDMSNILPAYSDFIDMENCYFIYLTYDETISTPTYMGGEIHLIFNYGSAGYNACNFNRVYDAVFADDSGTPTECPTLEEQIAGYTGTWDELANIIQANNSQLYSQLVNNWYGWYNNGYDNGLSAGYDNGFDAGFSEGHTEGYAEGYNQALNGNAIRDPIDQYWNSTKDYILIAGQPYFAPNGFGSIDEYNTVGIYGEHESKLNKRDGSTQAFNGQYVTQFASTGTLGGGWYKIGANVGDANAYEQTLTVGINDKAYYVARVSPLGDPVEEFLVAIWVDGYEAWYVAEEFVHYGTVANNNNSYKQVYSIYFTDIRPTAQRFINYDTPVLHETFNEDINATLYLATFNQLNNYNVYTDGIGIVESYNNGFDAGANTTLWLDLLSQPIVAFFSIPLAQVIVEGVTYTLTYGIVLGAGIVALIVVWFLKLFAGG